MANLIRVTQSRSTSKCTPVQKATLLGLGLKRRGRTKVLLDTPEIRGMVLKVQHLLNVECVPGDDSMRDSQRLRKVRAADATQR